MKFRIIAVLLSFLLFFTFLHISTVQASTTKSTQLSIDVLETGSVNVIISIKLPENYSDRFYIVLPFQLTDKSDVFPTSTLCSYDIIDNKFTLLSVIQSENSGLIEIKCKTTVDKLGNKNGDVQTINLSFIYSNDVILQLQKNADSITDFDQIKIVFPASLNQNDITEIPPATIVSGNARFYNRSEITLIGQGSLNVKYFVQAIYWLNDMLFSFAFGIIPSIGALKITPNRNKKNRYLFLVPLLFLYAVTTFSTYMLITVGPTWGNLSKYYGGLILLDLPISLWWQKIFGKPKTNPSIITQVED